MVAQAPIGHHHAALLAVDQFVQIDEIVLQCAGQNHGFDCRARLVKIGDRPIAPLPRFQPRHLVGIKFGPDRHRQNRAGLRLHHDGNGALGFRLAQRVVQRLLHLILDDLIHGQAKVVTLGRLGRSRIFREDDPADRIPFDQQPAPFSPQQLVVTELDALQSLVIQPGKADQMAHEGAFGIEAPVFGDHADPLVIQRQHGLRAGRRHLPVQPDKWPIRGEAADQLLLGPAQDGRQLGADGRRTINGGRHRKERGQLAAHRQHPPLPVVNGAPLRLNGDHPLLLPLGSLGQLLGPQHL